MEKERKPEAVEVTFEQRFQNELATIMKVSSLADFPEELTPAKYDCEDWERWRSNE